MALIPGTLPNDTCYGTPQDLLELFAQYLDVPAFALSSKVVFSTTNTGFTSDIVWFDTTSATRPIMKITVSSSGFLDYVKNYITAAPVVTIVGADSVLILDASDSGNTKRGLVSDIVPAAGSVTPAQLSQPFTRGTAVTTTAVTAIDLTGIPSWAKRVTLMFNGVSTNGGAAPRIRLGTSSGFVTSGYLGSCLGNATINVSNVSFSLGFDINDGATAGATRFGIFTFICIDTSDNWVLAGSQSQSNTAATSVINGTVPLGGTLTQIRITTANGSDTFDAGSVINILFE